jgi:cell division protein FtsB
MDLRVERLSKLRALPRPEEGLRTLVEHAPQAEAFADRTMERLRPALTALHRARRRIATGVVGVLTVWLFFHVMFGANGMVVYRQKRAEYQELVSEVDREQKENDRSMDNIKDLKSNPKTIEKVAREELHYTRPGEVVYVAPPPPQRPVTNSAKK